MRANFCSPDTWKLPFKIYSHVIEQIDHDKILVVGGIKVGSDNNKVHVLYVWTCM